MSINRISLDEWLSSIGDEHKKDEERFCFILGAGASKSSGIPTGKEFAEKWLSELREIDPDGIAEWLKDNDAENDPARYFWEIYEKRSRCKKLSPHLMLNEGITAEPSIGYAFLTGIMSRTHNMAVTTNFDSLLEFSYIKYSEFSTAIFRPGKPISKRYFEPMMTIIKLQDDFSPDRLLHYSTSDPIDPNIKQFLVTIFASYTMLVIGYNGNDGRLMSFMGKPEVIIKRIIWFYPENEHEPGPAILNLLETRESALIPVKNFDELMIRLSEKLPLSGIKLEKLAIEIEKRALDVNYDLADALLKKMQKEEETEDCLERNIDDLLKTPANFVLEAMICNDPQELYQIYLKGITKFPDSPMLLGLFAVQLEEYKHDFDSAEKYYQMALDKDPNHFENLGYYANFLLDHKNDVEKAEEMFVKALSISPKDVGILANYARLLFYFRKDLNRAAELLRSAIEEKPEYAYALDILADILLEWDTDYDLAETYLQRAVDAESDNEIHAYNYAYFLNNHRKDYYKADIFFRWAIEAAPQNAAYWYRYANFLKNIRKDYDKAEAHYQKALELEPENADFLTTFAIFLYKIRKQNETAREYFEKALHYAPVNSKVLYWFALFLTKNTGEHDLANTYFLRAIEFKPMDSDILVEYAMFLLNIKKDSDKAEEYFKKAVLIDENDANILEEYATFLTNVRRDFYKAEEFYCKAIELDNANSSLYLNYVETLILLKRDIDAIEKLHIAEAIAEEANDEEDILVLWFLRYMFYSDKYQESKKKVLSQLSIGIKSGNWEFKNLLEEAEKRGHSDMPEVYRLSRLINGLPEE